jgi:hypothetical protein
MTFSTRNPADLEIGKTYTFTRLLNNFSYKMTFRGTSQERQTTQETQWLGNSNLLETVYMFDCEHPNGAKGPCWVWTYEIANGVYNDGTWTSEH